MDDDETPARLPDDGGAHITSEIGNRRWTGSGTRKRLSALASLAERRMRLSKAEGETLRLTEGRGTRLEDGASC